MPSLRFIGATVRLARHQQGLSTQDVAAITRIPERYVRAIESGDFVILPGKPFIFGFTRTIGQLLRLDADRLVADVRAEMFGNSAAKVETPHPAHRAPAVRSRAR